jgi:hypothetical protein
VRAIGELAGEAERVSFDEAGSGTEDDDNGPSTATSIVRNPLSKKEEIDYKLYKPNIVGDNWIVSDTDLCMDLNHLKSIL